MQKEHHAAIRQNFGKQPWSGLSGSLLPWARYPAGKLLHHSNFPGRTPISPVRSPGITGGILTGRLRTLHGRGETQGCQAITQQAMIFSSGEPGPFVTQKVLPATTWLLFIRYITSAPSANGSMIAPAAGLKSRKAQPGLWPGFGTAAGGYPSSSRTAQGSRCITTA